jgi:hypothetical protein
MWNPFYNSPEQTFNDVSIIRTFTILDKGSLQISHN